MIKKCLLFLVIVLSIFSCCFAESLTLEYDGKSHIYDGPDVKLILNGEVFKVTEGLMPPVIVESRTLVPVREVFEILGGKVTWNAEKREVTVTLDGKSIALMLDATTANVDGKEILLDVPAKLINSKTMVPVRFISENGGLDVLWDGVTSTVSITKESTTSEKNKITSVEYEKINDVDCIVVSNSTPVNEYKYFSLENPDRLIIDVYDSKFSISTESRSLENDKISGLRFGIQENEACRIVLDLKSSEDYIVVPSSDKLKLYIALAKEFKLEEETNIDEDDEETTETPEITYSYVTGIKYSATYNRVKAITNGNIEYTDFVLTEPNRIVVDLKNTKLNTDAPTTITPRNKNITAIRFSQKDDATVRIVIDLNTKSSYEIEKLDDEIRIDVEEIKYRNVEYVNNGDTSELILSDVKLSTLTRKQNTSTKTYTISYSSSKFSTGSGVLNPNDDLVSKITITSSKITIKDAGKMSYIARQSGDNVIITIKKKDESKLKTVIIDVGHGGSDPGACNGSDYEKIYNLKIALKLYDLLENTENIEVIIDRDDDTYLSREDRVEFINGEKDADLLVSIHNNSLANKSYSGTMVLFYNKDTDLDYGVTSKEYAQNVLSKLVDALDTVNRGTVSREDLHVLSKTNIPAILCEICFVSNDDELAKLKTSKFQEAAANAIYEGILETIEEMN